MIEIGTCTTPYEIFSTNKRQTISAGALGEVDMCDHLAQCVFDEL